MPSYKNEKNKTWYCKFYYEDFFGERRPKLKRGFEKKKDADAWERDFLENHATTPDVTFDALANKYLEDRKANCSYETHRAREHDVRLYYNPYFSGKKVRDITPLMVREWQNTLKKKKNKYGRPYAATTLKSIHVGLSAIFNFGVRFYNTPNPAAKAGSMGSSKTSEMEIYTLSEFNTLMNGASIKYPYGIVFDALYWSGVRIGELLAMDISDAIFDKNALKVSKTLIGSTGRIQDHPKNDRGFRTILMPQKVMMDIYSYVDRMYDKTGRLFPFSHNTIRSHLYKASDDVGLHRIKVHELRHSQASLMIDLGYSVFAVAKRLGDTPEMILKTYGHMYKNKEQKLIQEYNQLLEK